MVAEPGVASTTIQLHGVAGVLPPGLSIGTEDEHRQGFNQISENIIHDDGAWTRDSVIVGQRINMLIIMLTRLFTHAENQEQFAQETAPQVQALQANIVEISGVIKNISSRTSGT